jgi:hypothetical protein
VCKRLVSSGGGGSGGDGDSGAWASLRGLNKGEAIGFFALVSTIPPPLLSPPPPYEKIAFFAPFFSLR